MWPYIGLLISNSIIPAFTLASSTKFVSVVSVRLYFASVSVNLSLSAPGAFSFVVPCELSNKLVSDEDVIKLYINPIVNQGPVTSQMDSYYIIFLH